MLLKIAKKGANKKATGKSQAMKTFLKHQFIKWNQRCIFTSSPNEKSRYVAKFPGYKTLLNLARLTPFCCSPDEKKSFFFQIVISVTDKISDNNLHCICKFLEYFIIKSKFAIAKNRKSSLKFPDWQYNTTSLEKGGR